MALYLFHGSYNAAAAKAMIDSPHDRGQAAGDMFSSAGGTLHHMYLALGESDFFIVGELPDTKAAMALSMQVAASGNFTSFKTVPLLSTAEGAEAMKTAKSLTYRPPTGAGR